jgi:hypothetical protein
MWSVNAHYALRLFAPIESSHGYSSEILLACEEKLETRLPTSLIQALALCGRRNDIWRSRDVLLIPNEIKYVDEFLVIGAENQGSWIAGIPISELWIDNPPVFRGSLRGNDLNPYVWTTSWSHCSDFLDYLAFGNALCGGCESAGVVYISSAGFAELNNSQGIAKLTLRSGPMEQSWNEVGPETNYFIGDGTLLKPDEYCNRDNSFCLVMAANSHARFDDLAFRLQGLVERTWAIEWSNVHRPKINMR